jgi:hypothetical protein
LNWRDGHGEMPKKPLWVCGPRMGTPSVIVFTERY